jgi:glutamate/aspartate transport system substrate-binding protein
VDWLFSGIMVRKGEPQLEAVVERTFRKLGSGRGPDPALQQMVRVAATDRRKTRRCDLAATEEAFKSMGDSPGGSN